MKIGVFGGSFDPIHNGHIAMIRGALKSRKVDIVIVIPAARNSFKRGCASSPAPYRLFMTEDAVEELSSDRKKKAFVSDIEFHIDGISYTAETLRRLTDRNFIEKFLTDNGVSGRKASSEHEYSFICGSDILKSFDRWKDPDVIIGYAGLLVAMRPGDTTDIGNEISRLREVLGADLRIGTFEIDGVEESSSRIKAEKDFGDIPKAARKFIETHDLYENVKILQEASEETANRFMDLSIELYGLLSRKRLLHTINTGLLSGYYAKCHGADIDKALIAGLLHDCAKEIDLNEQLRLACLRSGSLFTEKKLLHSPAGAYMTSDRFGISDEEILDAITYHTTGRGDMTTLDKIVYLADKLEPSRTYTDLSEMRRIAPTDLDGAVRLCLMSVMDKFRRQGREMHPLTDSFARDMGCDL